MGKNGNGIPSDCKVQTLDNATAQEILWSPIEDAMYTIGLPVVCGTGFLANVAFLFVLFRVPAMRTVTNAYLGNVAAADLWFVSWVGCSYVPQYFLTPVRHDVYFRSAIGCGLAFGAAYFGYFASTLLITIVTAERYFAICRPFQHRLIAGRKHTLQMISFSWLIAIILFGISLPSWTGIAKSCVIWPDSKKYRDFPTIVWNCNNPNRAVYTFGEMVLMAPFFVVLPVNVYMYGSIILTLSKRTSAFSDKDQAEIATRARNQIARLLIINGSVFLLCQAPYRFISIHYIAKFLGHGPEGQGFLSPTVFGILLLASRLLVLINSCCNPFIYYFTSSFYRQAFYEAFCFGKSHNAHGGLNVSSVSGKSRATDVV